MAGVANSEAPPRAYGGFGIRLAAYLLDNIAMIIALLAVGLFLYRPQAGVA